jgi:hypothetical protein
LFQDFPAQCNVYGYGSGPNERYTILERLAREKHPSLFGDKEKSLNWPLGQSFKHFTTVTYNSKFAGKPDFSLRMSCPTRVDFLAQISNVRLGWQG